MGLNPTPSDAAVEVAAEVMYGADLSLTHAPELWRGRARAALTAALPLLDTAIKAESVRSAEHTALNVARSWLYADIEQTKAALDAGLYQTEPPEARTAPLLEAARRVRTAFLLPHPAGPEMTASAIVATRI